MKFIKYWYWRKYKGIPHHHEMCTLYVKRPLNCYRFTTAFLMVQDYILGDSIEKLAEKFSVTRERVRQVIWKYYRKWR